MTPFEARYRELNPEQKEAVDTLEGPVMVIAGPGTGKTEVLTMRIANLLHKKKTVPERILALTFTEAGAITMRRRLSELAGREAYRTEIATFHGFANRVIRDYPDYFPRIVGAASITEIDQVRILRDLIDTLPLAELRPFGDRYLHLRTVLRAIGEVKQQGVPPDEFAVIVREEKEAFYANPDLVNESGKYEGKMKTKYASQAKKIARNLELAEIYAAYQAALQNARQYDFSDMIMEVARALQEREEMRRVLRDAYDYFRVDEHQDTNDAQNRIIELLADREEDDRAGSAAAGAGPNLFVVGDERQAIFRFQGASIENFHYFSRKYRGVKLIFLRANYRSTQAILDAAQGVSPREASLVAKAGHFAPREEPPAHLAALSSPDAEYFFIARKIKELIRGAAGRSTLRAPSAVPEEIAVLYRDNRDAAPLARMLEKEEVPYVIESDQDVLGDPEIRKLVRILRAVEHFGNDVALAEALHADFLGIAPIDIYKLASFAARNRKNLHDAMRSDTVLEAAGIDDPAARAALTALFAKFSSWKRAAENQGAADAFETIVRESGFLAHLLRHPSATEELAKLHALFDLLKSFVERKRDYTLAEFFAHLDLMGEHGVALKNAGTLRLPGRVRLMTAHRAKGQEFDYVFIMNAVDRKWGSRFHRETIKIPDAVYRVLAAAPDAAVAAPATEARDEAASDDDADERNVFYVALTRARREVFVTLARTDREGKEQLPSKFIAELRDDLLAPYDAAPYERELAAHGELAFRAPAPRTPELKDREFLNALFAEQGISVTALNNYLECPWQYFYRNLIRIPEAPNKHLSFGNAVHAALKSWFDAFDAGDDRGAARLIARFEEALAHEPIREDEYEEALAKGRAALAAFYREYRASWDGASPAHTAENEARVDGASVGDGTPINGKLDRIEFPASDPGAGAGAGNRAAALPAAALPVARVIDYKTGKPKTRNVIEGNTKDADGNYKRQIVFYKLLLDKAGKCDMKEGVIQFVEPDERGTFHREPFSVAPEETAALEREIIRVAKEIRSLAFWDTTCGDPECEYCELRREMGATVA